MVTESGTRPTVPTPPPSPSPLDTAAVREALDAAVGREIVGALVRVSDGNEVWRATAGSAEEGRQRPVPADGSFRIGSVTKTFVAVVVFQLAAEGRVELHRTVQQQAPGLLPDDPPVTVHQLLQHTSGVPNYLPLVERGPERRLRERYRGWTPEELLAIALGEPRVSEPGAALNYSNTNYVLLGLLIRELTGRRWDEEVARRITRPLGLGATFCPGDNPALPEPHARGYTTSAATGRADITQLNTTVYDAAGSMVSTADDLDAFLAALLAGPLVPPPLLAEMLTPHPEPAAEVPQYLLGAGAVEVALPEPCATPAVHGGAGSLPGYTTALLGTRDGRRRVVVSLTLATADVMSPVEPLLAIVRAAFCGRRP